MMGMAMGHDVWPMGMAHGAQPMGQGQRNPATWHLFLYGSLLVGALPKLHNFLGIYIFMAVFWWGLRLSSATCMRQISGLMVEPIFVLPHSCVFNFVIFARSC